MANTGLTDLRLVVSLRVEFKVVVRLAQNHLSSQVAKQAERSSSFAAQSHLNSEATGCSATHFTDFAVGSQLDTTC